MSGGLELAYVIYRTVVVILFCLIITAIFIV